MIVNNIQEQEKVAAEQAAILEEERMLEQIRISELENSKMELLEYLNANKEEYYDWFTEEDLSALNSIEDKINNANDSLELLQPEEEMYDIINNVIELKESVEAQQEAQYYNNNNSSYASNYYTGYDESYAKSMIRQFESGGDYSATNGRYWGAYQLDNSWFAGYDKDFILYTEEGHAIQDQIADSYTYGRYGSWNGALQWWYNNGWY